MLRKYAHKLKNVKVTKTVLTTKEFIWRIAANIYFYIKITEVQNWNTDFT